MRPGDWPDVCVALLLEGYEDSEIAEVAGLSADASAWVVEPLVSALLTGTG